MATQLAREAGAYIIGTGRAAGRQTALDFGAQPSGLCTQPDTIRTLK
jgi:hypothetical protein